MTVSEPGAELPPWTRAAAELAKRVIGPAADGIRFSEVEATRTTGDGSRRRGVRSFDYTMRNGALHLEATDGVAASVGLHTYLRESNGTAVGWDTPLPLTIAELPATAPVHREARVRESYYLNFCTYSYTMAYWSWADWEREIDWMALHGITMPLALTGHEAVLHLAYSRLGLDDHDILEFIGGPGYLPFQFMGCLDHFGGTMSSEWLDSHRDLGARILKRERELGMTPVLPAFTGHVPVTLAPERVTGRQWQGCTTHVLSPDDPLYRRVGSEIVRAQIELFGTDHLYAADPFIEMIPVESAAEFPGRVASATIQGLQDADDEAVWVMQAWPFSYQQNFWTQSRVDGFLTAIPDDSLLLLDLWAEHDPQWRRTGQFAGNAWIWCGLLNFGGRTDAMADLRGLVQSIDAAMVSPNPPAGFGLTMEGTRNNPAFFELLTDQLWATPDDHHPQDLDHWIADFARQRYGTSAHPELMVAWRSLLNTIYAARNIHISPGRFHGVLTTAPSYVRSADLAAARQEISGLVWYDLAELLDAWLQMIKVAERDGSLTVGALGHDLIDIGIAISLRVADLLYLQTIEASSQGVSTAEQEMFLSLFEDLDRLLATRTEFTFAGWEAQAAAWGSTPQEQANLIDNARRLITVWNAPGDPALDDYAGRVWAGLVGGYYRDRWALWADKLDAAMAHPTSSDLAAHQTRLDRELVILAERFLEQGAPIRTIADLDVVVESRRLHARCAAALAPPPQTGGLDR